MPAVHFLLLFESLITLQKYLFLPLPKGNIMKEIWTVKTVSKQRQPSFTLFLFHKKGGFEVVFYLVFVWIFLRAREKGQYSFYVRIKTSLVMG